MARPDTRIQLTEQEAATLREWTRKGTAEPRYVDRARIILLSHEGRSVRSIATQLRTSPARVSKWRQRFAKLRLNALSDAPRAGKPRTYSAATEKRVLTLLEEPAPDGYAQWNGRL